MAADERISASTPGPAPPYHALTAMLTANSVVDGPNPVALARKSSRQSARATAQTAAA